MSFGLTGKPRPVQASKVPTMFGAVRLAPPALRIRYGYAAFGCGWITSALVSRPEALFTMTRAFT